MTNKRISRMLVVLSIMFLSLIVYMTAFDVLHHEEYAQTYADERLSYVRRGKIKDRNGVILAQSTGKVHEQTREYPYANMYSHIIGDFDEDLIEKKYNNELMGTSDEPVLGDIVTMFNDAKHALKDKKNEQKGYDITLTVDHDVQEVMYRRLSSYKNASAVAMDPKTGEILAMVSLPDYNPSPDKVAQSKEYAKESNNGGLFHDAFRNQFFPGSTAKIITACALIEEGYENYIVNETDRDSLENKKIYNYGKSSGIDNRNLESAFINSSNIYFSEAAIMLGSKTYMNYAEKFMYNTDFMMDSIPVSKSNMILEGTSLSNLTLGGEGNKATPLHMAMIASAIANDGEMMMPHIVKEIGGPTGSTLNGEYKKCISSRTADKVKNLMYRVVEEGTGRNAKIQGYKVCGKTGSADAGGAVFVGFAPKDNPKIAVAVVVENVNETGGAIAAPIARDIMSAYLNKISNKN